MKNLKYSLLYALSFLSIFGSAQESETYNWTRFRGNDGMGIESNMSVPVTWDSTDFNWTIELPGIGNASPVVWGEKIFVTAADDEKDLGYLIAVDENDGSVVWQNEFTVTDLLMHIDNNLAMPTPAVDVSCVYTIWYSKEKIKLVALTHDGTQQWETEFAGIEAQHGGGSSLILTDKYVVFSREQEEGSSYKSSWVAVNKKTGITAWKLDRETGISNSFSTPLELKIEGQPTQLIFGSRSHGITGVDPESGEVLWERKNLLPSRVVASPIYSDGMLVLCRKGGGLVIDLNKDTNQAADTVRYSLPRNISPYVPTPIVVNGLLFLYMDNGTVSCLDLASGELLWKERPAGAIYGSPICVGGKLYCMTKAGDVMVINAKSTYHLSSIYKLGDGSFSTPVMSESGMIFRTFSKLMMLKKQLIK